MSGPGYSEVGVLREAFDHPMLWPSSADIAYHSTVPGGVLDESQRSAEKWQQT